MNDLSPEDADRVRTLRQEDLLPLLEQTFEVRELDAGFVLHAVEDLTREDEEPEGRRPFSALFRHRGGAHHPQRIYHLHHPAVGMIPLFLVPVGEVDDEGLYEAILR